MYTSRWVDIVSCPLFDNEIKNDITNSEVCLLKTNL